VPQAVISAIGADSVQGPDVVARSVIYLFASQSHGACVYSDKGKFWDIEDKERGLIAYGHKMLGYEYKDEEHTVKKLRALLAKELDLKDSGDNAGK